MRDEVSNLGLINAIKNDDVREVGRLLYEGGNALEIYEGRTLLCYAKSVEIADLLIRYGANPKEKGILCGDCVGNGNYDTVKYLIEKGADVNTSDDSEEGITPLILATACCQYRVVKLLLDNGADVNARDKVNMRAIDYAKMLDEKFLIEVLKKKKTDEEIEAYIRSSEIKTYFSPIFDIIKTIICGVLIMYAIMYTIEILAGGMPDEFSLFVTMYLVILGAIIYVFISF